MPTASLHEIVRLCQRLLRVADITDYDGAHNGLQVENRGSVTHIAAAVDASLATAKLAARAGTNLLVVHHGLFWGARHPWTGRNYELFRFLIEHDLAVYSVHLPLDMHPRLGNNAGLCAALGFKSPKPFFWEKNQCLGLQTTARLPLNELARRLQHTTGATPVVIPGGPKICRRVGVVTGGAGGHLGTAAREGVDTFITGEGPHWSYAQAEELGINVLYGGHYATETFGVKSLATHLSGKFKVPWTFVDHPTGL